MLLRRHLLDVAAVADAAELVGRVHDARLVAHARVLVGVVLQLHVLVDARAHAIAERARQVGTEVHLGALLAHHALDVDGARVGVGVHLTLVQVHLGGILVPEIGTIAAQMIDAAADSRGRHVIEHLRMRAHVVLNIACHRYFAASHACLVRRPHRAVLL